MPPKKQRARSSRFASVCKSWRQAAETVLKSSGIEKSAKKKHPDTTALRTQFTVIEEYVDRMDDKSARIERSATLADNHPFAKNSKKQTGGRRRRTSPDGGRRSEPSLSAKSSSRRSSNRKHTASILSPVATRRIRSNACFQTFLRTTCGSCTGSCSRKSTRATAR